LSKNRDSAHCPQFSLSALAWLHQLRPGVAGYQPGQL
jgi:hypothetical protein